VLSGRPLIALILMLPVWGVKATVASPGGKVGTVCCAAKAACEYKAMDVYFMQTGAHLLLDRCDRLLGVVTSLFHGRRRALHGRPVHALGIRAYRVSCLLQ
jgi:hypothetical protein